MGTLHRENGGGLPPPLCHTFHTTWHHAVVVVIAAASMKTLAPIFQSSPKHAATLLQLLPLLVVDTITISALMLFFLLFTALRCEHRLYRALSLSFYYTLSLSHFHTVSTRDFDF